MKKIFSKSPNVKQETRSPFLSRRINLDGNYGLPVEYINSKFHDDDIDYIV